MNKVDALYAAVGVLIAEEVRCHPAQLPVDARSEPLEGVPIACGPGAKELRCLRVGSLAHGLFLKVQRIGTLPPCHCADHDLRLMERILVRMAQAT